MPETTSQWPHTPPYPTSSGVAPETETSTGLTAIVERRLTPRQRRRRLAVIAACVLIALAVVVGGAANIWSQTGQALRRLSSTATAAIAPGADLLYVVTDVPGTTLTVDGNPVPTPAPDAGAPLRLTRGRHLIGWRADPFAQQDCLLTVPPAANDTCSARMEGTLTRAGAPPVRVLHAGESLLSVTPSQQQLLLSAIRIAFETASSSTYIQPGEPYFAENAVATASEAIPAELTYAPAVDTNVLPGNSSCEPQLSSASAQPCPTLGTCPNLCTVPWSIRQAAGGPLRSTEDWYVLAVYYPSWTYSLPDTAAANQPVAPDGSANQLFAVLRVHWDTATRSWQATALFDDMAELPLRVSGLLAGTNPNCVALHQLLVGQSSVTQQANIQVRYIPAFNPADGCVADVNNTADSSAPAAIFLYRFGIALAANDVAHRLGPNLPLAGDYAQQLAAQLSVLPGGWIG